MAPLRHADRIEQCPSLGCKAEIFCSFRAILRRYRRSLLLRLEYAPRSTLEDHVHRITPVGAQVLINGIWYYRTLGADQRAAVAAMLGRIIPAPTKARAAINELESSWQRGAPFRANCKLIAEAHWFATRTAVETEVNARLRQREATGFSRIRRGKPTLID